MRDSKRYTNWVKRFFDLALSISAFFFLSLLMQYLDRYTPEQARLHEAKRLL